MQPTLLRAIFRQQFRKTQLCRFYKGSGCAESRYFIFQGGGTGCRMFPSFRAEKINVKWDVIQVLRQTWWKAEETVIKLCFHSFVGLLLVFWAGHLEELHLLSAHLWCFRMQIALGYGFVSKKSGEPPFHLLVLRITILTWPRFETSTVTRFWSFTKQLGTSHSFLGGIRSNKTANGELFIMVYYGNLK